MLHRSSRQVGGKRHAQPYMSLQTKAIVCAILLVAVSTGLCGLITAWLAHQSLSEALRRDARLLAETMARSVGSRADLTRQQRLAQTIDHMSLDPRIAFVTVSDERGNVVARRIADTQAWSTYADRMPAADRRAALQFNKTAALPYRGGVDLLVATEPIWHRPLTQAPATLEGRLVLAMSDPAAQRMMSNFQAAVIAVVGVISLLCLPPVIAVARSWTRPLRRMLVQTRNLTEGRSPEPIQIRQRDEIGQLATGFNEMADNLWRARADLIAANRDLEQQVTQRTDQLRQANELLKLQMRDKDEFIRAVTHDLNAPVRNIAGMTKLLLMKYRDELTDEALAKLERIAANARTESELLADLLELSRIRTQPGKQQPIDLDDLVRSIAEGLSYDTETRGIEIHIAAGMPPLHADRNRMRQVFQNLLDNAVKYMPADAATKRIEVGHEVHDDDVVFYVRDTGRGIADKDHERVFQVFQRARYSGDPDIGGRGVGLASVKTIIETCGGRIWIDSVPGRGATFYFTLGAACTKPEPATVAGV